MDQVLLNLSTGLGLQHTIGWFLPILLGTVNVLPSLLVLFQYADKSAEYNKQKGMEEKESLDDAIFDFIVVGGGTAGSVVANRLSAKYKVLLLERGGEPHPLTSVPGLESLMINRPETGNPYLTVPQNNSCLSLNNKQSLWSRGIGLGGTSLVNSMTYLRGHPYDYDIWAYWTKDERWNYQSLVPYFLRSETYCFSCDQARGRNPTHPAFHGSDGELHLQKAESKLTTAFIDAMEWAGVPRADLNAPFVRGVDMVTYNQQFGRRMSTRDAFLDPIKKSRKNLKIVKYATVTKILFDGTRTYGVEYEHFGKMVHAGVTKEVVLSAGAIESPKLLMLSGIGPKDHLAELEIPVLLDSPGVGENLQDHVGTMLGPFLINQPHTFISERDLTLEAAEEFLKNGTGPLSLTFPHGVAIFPSSKAEFPMYPDIQVGFSANGLSPSVVPVLSRIYNIDETLLSQFYAPLFQERETIDSFNLIVNYGRPRSRGVVRLRSKNYQDDPLIDPNYFSSEQDLEILAEGLKLALEVGENSPSFRKVKSQLSPFPWPKCRGSVQFRSEAYFRCLSKELTLALHHYSGTLRMGKEGPLDSELRVKGVQGLRVLDASVMPFITTMNTMAPTIMLAERGADFILESWSKDKDNEIIEDEDFMKQNNQQFLK